MAEDCKADGRSERNEGDCCDDRDDDDYNDQIDSVDNYYCNENITKEMLLTILVSMGILFLNTITRIDYLLSVLPFSFLVPVLPDINNWL